MNKISIVRKEHFNAAHRLHNHLLSNEENAMLFGKCNNPNYHGHNYDLRVKVTGFIDQRSGYVIDTKYLSQLIQVHVLDRLDHKNLNLDVPELTGINPTTENLAVFIYDTLRSKLGNEFEMKITLYETERNFVEYPA
jgi:6-pyruvoyltetrahydropterin/6-carboxytetrahydropterin synthase